MRFPFLALCLSAGASPLFAQTAPRAVAARPALPNDIRQLAARVKPSVVTIVCEKPRSAADKDEDKAPAADPTLPFTNFGTGWVFRADGLILTSYHVVRDALSVHVSFGDDMEDIDSDLVPARVVGYDADADIAVLKINRAGLPALPLTDSDATQTGQWVLAVGAPFGLPQSVTLGVLSGRDIESESPSPVAFLQTDALLSPSSSGGPLLDLKGRVVGLNTEGGSTPETSPGIGLSLPSNAIRTMLPQLLAGKPVKRGFVGIGYAQLAPDAAREFGLKGGLVISSLSKKSSPAKVAGVQQGDIVLSANQKPVRTREQLRALVLALAPGDKLSLNIARPDFAGARNIKHLTISLVLGDRAAALNDGTAPAYAIAPLKRIAGSGLSVGDAKALDAAHKDRFGLDGTESGAVTMSVAPTSRADEAGLHEGDRIVRARLDGKWTDISSAASWNQLESSAPSGARLLLEVRGSDDESEFRVLVLPAKPKQGEL